ncbi:MAG: hypothetical protein DDT22_00209 [candidate division WS2 bacterium]|nr:hypothetical protein [Candidatus Lithacetigena glycinireducens]MBT9174549.1 hypothetical protein [Candidatus Lithacetigena glycinireducens]
MYRSGQVVSINNKEVEVKCFPGESSNCQSCGWGCSKRTPNLKANLPDDLFENASVGDRVVVYIPDQSVFMLSTIVFLIPTVALITGVVIGGNLNDNANTGYLLGGTLGFIIGISCVYILRKFISFQPKVVELMKGGFSNGR